MAIAPNPRYTDRDRISHEDYLKLIGLLALAEDHNRALHQIEMAAAKITGEFEKSESRRPGDFGHTSDAILEEPPDAAGLLNRLGIQVEPPPPVEVGD